MVKNTLGDLNNHLFEQLERLNDEDLEGEKLDAEIARAKAISGISRDIISNANLVLKAKLVTKSNEYNGLEAPKILEG